MIASGAADVTRRGIPHRTVQHLVNQRIAVGRTGDGVVMFRADELRRHIDGQRSGIRSSGRVGQGVVEGLLRRHG